MIRQEILIVKIWNKNNLVSMKKLVDLNIYLNQLIFISEEKEVRMHLFDFFVIDLTNFTLVFKK